MKRFYQQVSMITILSLLSLFTNGCSSRRDDEIPAEASPSPAQELSPKAFGITQDDERPSATPIILPAATVPAEADITRDEVPSMQADLLIADDITSPKIMIKKSERILELWDGDRLHSTYSVGLGWEPEGDKKQEGDGRTPEGTYYVCTRNGSSRFYLSLGISYPNKEDAREALASDTIDQGTYEQIAYAIDNGEQPPWDTALGGEIMIHGYGSSSDWTAGCIAVDNDVMDILWEHCPVGTAIIIKP